MVDVPVCVDDKPNRIVGEVCDRRHDLLRERRVLVDHERAVLSNAHRDVATASLEHEDRLGDLLGLNLDLVEVLSRTRGRAYGESLERLARGGEQVRVLTLSRFYALHVFFLPGLLTVLAGLHLPMVVRQGIATPPNGAFRSIESKACWDTYERAKAGGRPARHRLEAQLDTLIAHLVTLR